MRLLITDEVGNETSFDTVIMTGTEFNTIHSHPFIISSNFDAVIVDLRVNINIEYLSYLMKDVIVIPKVIGEISPHAVTILCELYKDKSAELRITYLRDREAFNKIVATMRKQYDWDSFY